MKNKKLLSIRLLVFSMLMFSVVACEDDAAKPTAQIEFEIDTENPNKVIFNSLLTNTTSVLWDFGDGTTTTIRNPIYTYPVGGEYTVSLTASGLGGTTEAVASVSIEKAFLAISLENGDFQLPGTSKQSNWTNVPGWNSDTPATDSGVEGGGDSWTAFKKTSDPAVFNLTDHVIADGEEFKITMDVWDIWNAPQFTIKFYYDTGNGIRTVIEEKTFDIVSGQNNSLELIVGATAASVGSKLGIEFVNASSDGGDGWDGFDNVKVSGR